MLRPVGLYSPTSGNEEMIEDYLATMDLLLDDDRVEWAWDTIEGIKENVSRTKRITQRQIDTIDGYQRKIEEL